jgi:putative redox protein
MKAMIKRIQGLSLAAKADSGHWTPMDTGVASGGANAASSPMELVLMALGGCTSMDVLSILEKKRVALTDYKVELEAVRATEHPMVFTSIMVKFLFYGRNIPKEAVERAIALSEEKYCSVSAMLKKSVPIKIEYEIIEN